MSKGPGRIERALDAIFDDERDNAFTLEDLAERIYPGDPVAKAHRVSIARAARHLSRRRPEIQCLHGQGLGGALVFFRHDEVLSYAMARLKADNFQHYRSRDERVYDQRDEADLRRKLKDETHRKLIAGAWRRHVEMFLAERDGDSKQVARLHAEQEAELTKDVAEILGRR